MDCGNLISNIKVTDKRVEFIANEALSLYLNENFFYEYESGGLIKLDSSIVSLPFIYNIAPVVWFSGLIFKINTCDETTYKNLTRLKEVFKKQYPKVNWDGDIICNEFMNLNLEEDEQQRLVCLFSGGVDAINTSLRHIDKEQLLVSVRGADVSLDNHEGWAHTVKQNRLFAKTMGFEFTTISSNVIDFINTSKLTDKNSGIYNWWGCVQHGMGLCGLTMPLLFLQNIKLQLIASTFCEGYSKPWGSSPEIDTLVSSSFASTVHDSFDLSRQQKIDLIATMLKSEKKSVCLRVCHARPSFGQGNCGQCEKCLRTIFGFLIEGSDITSLGFTTNDKKQAFNRLEKKLKNIKLSFGDVPNFFWNDIQRRARELKSVEGIDDQHMNWLMTYNFDEYHSRYKNVKKSGVNKKSILLHSVKKMVGKFPLIKKIVIELYSFFGR